MSMNIVPILIYGLSLVFLSLGTILSMIFFIFICINTRPLTSNVLLILIINTYLSLIVSSISLFEAALTSLLGNLNLSTYLGIVSCQIRSYLLLVALSSVTYSLILQAFFRLFRIVFYRKKEIRSLRVFSIAIILLWILIFLINLPYIFLNDFQYISSEYRCNISFTNLRGTAMVIILTYMIPVNIIFLIYFYIIRYIRQTTNAMQNRQNITRRDMVVFKRIIILFITLQILAIPLSVVWILYMITGYTTQWNYYLQVLTSSISQIIISVVHASTTSKIREKFKWRQREVHPNVEIRVRRHYIQETAH